MSHHDDQKKDEEFEDLSFDDSLDFDLDDFNLDEDPLAENKKSSSSKDKKNSPSSGDDDLLLSDDDALSAALLSDDDSLESNLNDDSFDTDSDDQPISNNGFDDEEEDDEDDSIEAGNGVLVYKGKRYAVGMNWLTADEFTDSGLVKERAKRLNADFMCLRNTIVTQQGFGYLKLGHKMGMNAAASLAADSLIGEWHGVFVAENGWWYVGVHADAIAPDGDRFFINEEDAYNYFMEAAESHQWPRTYAPESWNIPNTNGEIPLNKLFDDMPSVPLRPANIGALFGGKRNKEIILFVGILFGLALFAAVLATEIAPNLIPKPKEVVQPNIDMPDSLSIPPRGPQEQEAKANLGTSADGNAFLPQPREVVNSCLKGFATLTRSFPGWTLETLRCRNGLAEARWKRGTGSLDSLRPYLGQFPFGVSQSFSGDNLFIASTVTESSSEFDQEVRLPEREAAILALNDRFGKFSVINVRDIIPNVQQERERQNQAIRGRQGIERFMGTGEQASDDGSEMSLDELPYLAVEIRTNTPPNLMMHYFDIPGFSFDMIEWNIANQLWTYTARVILRYDRANSMRRQ